MDPEWVCPVPDPAFNVITDPDPALKLGQGRKFQSVHHKAAARLLRHSKYFLRNMYEIKDVLDHFKVQIYTKMLQIFMSLMLVAWSWTVFPDLTLPRSFGCEDGSGCRTLLHVGSELLICPNWPIISFVRLPVCLKNKFFVLLVCWVRYHIFPFFVLIHFSNY